MDHHFVHSSHSFLFIFLIHYYYCFFLSTIRSKYSKRRVFCSEYSDFYESVRKFDAAPRLKKVVGTYLTSRAEGEVRALS